MKNINITVENKRATVVGSPVIICGNSDYTVTFAFDSDWNVTGVRTARFVYVKDGKVQHEDVVFSGNTVAVPILSGIDSVKIGVFAGELRTTTPAVVRCGASILCGSGEVHEPTPDVYDQIMALFNELAERGGFGATEAQAQQIAQNQADIAALVSGTKKAGKAADADKLGGQSISYFVSKNAMDNKTFLSGESLSTSILAKAESLAGTTAGQHNFYLTGSNYTGDDLPHSNYTYSVASVFVRSTFLVVVVWGVGNLLPIFNGYDGSKTWRGWQTLVSTADLATALAKYLPLTGGTVGPLATNNLNVIIDGASDVTSRVMNSVRSIIQRVYANGAYRLHDITNNKEIIYSSPSGEENTFNGRATENLPFSGGEIVSEIYYPLGLYNTAYEHCFINYKGKSGRVGSLGFYTQNNPSFMDTDGNVKSLLHTGNSAKVHIGTSAPSDTSALWIDTSA